MHIIILRRGLVHRFLIYSIRVRYSMRNYTRSGGPQGETSIRF